MLFLIVIVFDKENQEYRNIRNDTSHAVKLFEVLELPIEKDEE
jgi:hypothetical protein